MHAKFEIGLGEDLKLDLHDLKYHLKEICKEYAKYNSQALRMENYMKKWTLGEVM